MRAERGGRGPGDQPGRRSTYRQGPPLPLHPPTLVDSFALKEERHQTPAPASPNRVAEAGAAAASGTEGHGEGRGPSMPAFDGVARGGSGGGGRA